jgi:hypothetical protein
MRRNAGVWIDYHEAFIVFLDGSVIDEASIETRQIESGVEKDVAFARAGGLGKSAVDDQHHRHFMTHIASYYDKVIEHIKAAKSIFLFGPGEAKSEFKTRLEKKGLGNLVVGVEATDSMTDLQIVTRAKHFYKNNYNHDNSLKRNKRNY